MNTSYGVRLRTQKLQSILNESNAALQEKDAAQSITLSGIADSITSIKAGAAMEYTTGTATFTRNYDKKSIEHGLSKPPKLFFLYWNEYAQSTSICLTCVCYTELVATVCWGSATEITFNPAYATMVGYNTPTYGGVTVNDNTVDISIVARQWEAGDWTWEAWTW